MITILKKIWFRKIVYVTPKKTITFTIPIFGKIKVKEVKNKVKGRKINMIICDEGVDFINE